MAIKPLPADSLEGWRWNQRRFTLAAYLLVSAMMACMTVSLVKLVGLFFPGWSGGYLVVFSFLLALEALYSRRTAEKLTFPEREWVLYRGTEWIVILVVLKVVYYGVYGLDLLREDLPLWWMDFETYFFNGEYLLGIAIAMLVWGVSTYFSLELSFLETDAQVLQIEQESGIFEARSAIRARLANLILIIGSAMIVFTAGMHMDSLVEWFELPVLQVGVSNVLLYFLLGLVLLSMTQFSLLRVGWILEKIPMQSEISGRWFLYSLGFILLAALLASLLPTRYSFGLLATLNYLTTMISGLMSVLFMLLMAPVFFVLGLLSMLFAGEGGAPEATEIPPLEAAPPPPSAPSLPWWEMLQSLAFWVVFLAVIGFSLAYYLNQHQNIALRLRHLPLLGLLIDYLGRLFSWAGGVNRQIGAALEAGIERWRAQRLARRQQPAWGFVNPRRLPPRQRVVFYYLAMVRRGGEQGVARRTSQTPYEYSQELESLVRQQGAPGQTVRPLETEPAPVSSGQAAGQPDPAAEIAALTDEFMEARYSQHEITEQHAGRVRRYWEHIRRAIARLRAKLAGPGEE